MTYFSNERSISSVFSLIYRMYFKNPFCILCELKHSLYFKHDKQQMKDDIWVQNLDLQLSKRIQRSPAVEKQITLLACLFKTTLATWGLIDFIFFFPSPIYLLYVLCLVDCFHHAASPHPSGCRTYPHATHTPPPPTNYPHQYGQCGHHGSYG